MSRSTTELLNLLVRESGFAAVCEQLAQLLRDRAKGCDFQECRKLLLASKLIDVTAYLCSGEAANMGEPTLNLDDLERGMPEDQPDSGW